MSIVYGLIVGAIAGWLTGEVMKGRGFGLIGNIVIGLVGGVIGGWIFNALGLSAAGLIGNIIVAFIGGVVLVAIVNFIKR